MNPRFFVGFFCILLIPVVFASEDLAVSLRSYPVHCFFPSLNFTANSSFFVNASSCHTLLDIVTFQDVNDSSLYIGFANNINSHPSGYVSVSSFISVESSPFLSSSLSSVFLRLFYSPGSLSQSGGSVDESSLRIFSWYGGQWHLLDSGVNASGSYAWANYSGFGVFGIFGRLVIVEGARIAGPGGCFHRWSCTGWSLCVDGLQLRTCSDTGTCNPFDDLVEQRECVIAEDAVLKTGVSLPVLSLPGVTALGTPLIVLLLFLLLVVFVVWQRRRAG